jgi:hypothetical protein
MAQVELASRHWRTVRARAAPAFRLHRIRFDWVVVIPCLLAFQTRLSWKGWAIMDRRTSGAKHGRQAAPSGAVSLRISTVMAEAQGKREPRNTRKKTEEA